MKVYLKLNYLLRRRRRNKNLQELFEDPRLKK
jgi:hypothetical protein